MRISADGLRLEEITNDDIDANGQLKVAIPNSVTYIGNWAFAGCTSLTSITIPNSVTQIGDQAFWGCTSLASITIPNSVTHIGDGAFSGCTSLTSITIPNSATYIGVRAFEFCTSLTSITIPDSVTHIEGTAFYDSKSLSNIIIGSDDKDEVARITALLPAKLQSKVIKKQSYNEAQVIISQSISCIANESNKAKEVHLSWLFSKSSTLLSTFPAELCNEIGKYRGSKYIDEAKQEMQGLKIPTDNNWAEYTVKVNAIAYKHITEAKTNYSNTVRFFCKGKNSVDEEPAAQPAP